MAFYKKTRIELLPLRCFVPSGMMTWWLASEQIVYNYVYLFGDNFDENQKCKIDDDHDEPTNNSWGVLVSNTITRLQRKSRGKLYHSSLAVTFASRMSTYIIIRYIYGVLLSVLRQQYSHVINNFKLQYLIVNVTAGDENKTSENDDDNNGLDETFQRETNKIMFDGGSAADNACSSL